MSDDDSSWFVLLIVGAIWWYAYEHQEDKIKKAQEKGHEEGYIAGQQDENAYICHQMTIQYNQGLESDMQNRGICRN